MAKTTQAGQRTAPRHPLVMFREPTTGGADALDVREPTTAGRTALGEAAAAGYLCNAELLFEAVASPLEIDCAIARRPHHYLRWPRGLTCC